MTDESIHPRQEVPFVSGPLQEGQPGLSCESWTNPQRAKRKASEGIHATGSASKDTCKDTRPVLLFSLPDSEHTQTVRRQMSPLRHTNTAMTFITIKTLRRRLTGSRCFSGPG